MNGNGNGYNVKDPVQSLKSIVFLFLGLALVAVIAAVATFSVKVNRAISTKSVPVEFTVPRGLDSKSIAEKLQDEGVLNAPWVFVIYVRLYDAADKIQAGEYLLDRNMSIAQIVDVLSQGKVISDERSLTVIEGWSNRQVADYLDQRNIFAREEFEAALGADYEFEFEAAKKFGYEGFLFPDTYAISKNAQPSDLITKMLANFEIKLNADLRGALADSGRDIADLIILASIIEKEVGRNKNILTDEDRVALQRERELVASVFYNRLKIGMPLESDATVNYVTGKSDRSVLIADTKIDSPYNTYRYRGLPPGPIGNPGLGAILAAISPAESDYYYFLNKPDGEAVFSRTFAEHVSNKNKYLP